MQGANGTSGALWGSLRHAAQLSSREPGFEPATFRSLVDLLYPLSYSCPDWRICWYHFTYFRRILWTHIHHLQNMISILFFGQLFFCLPRKQMPGCCREVCAKRGPYFKLHLSLRWSDDWGLEVLQLFLWPLDQPFQSDFQITFLIRLYQEDFKSLNQKHFTPSWRC